ncbi:SMI1/KNR4 family protein [Nonomuraea sp. NPDC005650]|uniref:SMI1/KNR4 family protein n=1 Tax=Nonomuraea sp. NPDC005650 TaxID=3157045 RepID=UPI0033B8D976
MTEDELIAAIRAEPGLSPPTTPAAVKAAEEAIGHPLPPLLRRLYLEVANGGFGPRDGVLGVSGSAYEHHDEWADIVEVHETLEPPEGRPGMVWLFDWGCATWSLVDCTDPAGPMWVWDPGGEPSLFPQNMTLAEWLAASLGGNLENAYETGGLTAVAARRLLPDDVPRDPGHGRLLSDEVPRDRGLGGPLSDDVPRDHGPGRPLSDEVPRDRGLGGPLSDDVPRDHGPGRPLSDEVPRDHGIRRPLSDDEIVVRIRETAALPPPAPLAAVAEAEEALGHPLPPLLRRLYLEVANGGFGPGGAVLGVPDAPGPRLGTDIVECRELFTTAPRRLVPDGMVWLCDWGSTIWSLVDCRDPAGSMWVWDPVAPGAVPGEPLLPQHLSLAAWLTAWLEGAYGEGFSPSILRRS